MRYMRNLIAYQNIYLKRKQSTTINALQPQHYLAAEIIGACCDIGGWCRAHKPYL